MYACLYVILCLDVCWFVWFCVYICASLYDYLSCFCGLSACTDMMLMCVCVHRYDGNVCTCAQIWWQCVHVWSQEHASFRMLFAGQVATNTDWTELYWIVTIFNPVVVSVDLSDLFPILLLKSLFVEWMNENYMVHTKKIHTKWCMFTAPGAQKSSRMLLEEEEKAQKHNPQTLGWVVGLYVMFMSRVSMFNAWRISVRPSYFLDYCT